MGNFYIACVKGIRNQKAQNSACVDTDASVICDHALVVAVVKMKQVPVFKKDRGKELLVGVPVAQGEKFQKFILDETADLGHVKGRAGEEAGAHATPAPLKVNRQRLGLCQRFWDIVDVNGGEAVARFCRQKALDGRDIEVAHALDVHVDPGEVGGAIGTTGSFGDSFLEHSVSGHAEQVVRRGVAVVEIIRAL